MKPRKTPPAPIDQALAYSIPDACRITGIGRTKLYALASEGELDLRKIGSRTIVTAASLRRFIDCAPRLA